MLVERLTVWLRALLEMFILKLMISTVGIQRISLQIRPRSHQRLHQDLYLINDRGPQTS
jgi:hypothetical protein